MSHISFLARPRFILMAAFCAAPLLSAQTLTFDGNTSVTGAQNGNGQWNTLSTNMNWWDGAANVAWVNGTSAIAEIGVPTAVANPTITVTEEIVLKELRLLAVTAGSIASGQQYTINGDVAGKALNFGQDGIIQMADRSSGGSQFVNLGSLLRLKGDNLRIQKVSGTAFQYITLSMTQNPDLTGPLTIGGSIYATITAPGTLQAVSRVVVEAGGSVVLSTVGSNYAMPFHLAGQGNSLAFTGTSYGAIRFIANNTTISGGILLTADAGVHSNFSGANGTTGLLINSPITDGGNGFAFHRFAFTRGNGTLTLAAANTYGGATVLGRAISGYSGGVTILDFTGTNSPQNNILYNGLTTPGNLDFIGGNSVSVLRLVGKAGQTHSQGFGNLSVNGTHSALELQPGLDGTMNVSVGTISRTDPASTMAITGPSSGAVTTTQADGFLGPWMTYSGADTQRTWARIVGGVITSGYTGDTDYVTGSNLNGAPYTATSNVTVGTGSTGDVLLGAASTQVRTISMTDYGVDRAIQVNAGEALRLGTQGGIQLVSGAKNLTVGASGTTGTLTAGDTVNTAAQLFLTNLSSTSPLTVNAKIVNNGTGLVTLVANGTPGSRTVLTGTNTYTGGTQISSGTLVVTNAGALGTTGTVTVVDGATLGLSGGITFTRALNAVGGFGDGNNGAIRSISGDNVISGNITQNAMFMIAADAGASLTIMPSSVISYSSALTWGGAGTITVNTALTGAGAHIKAGTGLVTFNGNNTYTGATTVNTGTLRLGSATALGVSSGAVITVGGTLDLNGFNSDRPITASGTGVGSSGSLVNSNTTTNSTLTGTTALSGAANVGGAGNITIINAGGLTGNVLLTKVGAGTLTISNTTAASARTGVNQIDAGTLRLQTGAGSYLTSIGTGAFALNGGTLSLGYDLAPILTNVVNVMSSSSIVADRATAGAGSTVQTLSTLTIGSSTLTVKPGANVTSGTMGLTMGAVSLGGPAMLPGDPVFNVQSTATAAMTLTLGALSDQAIAPRTITFQNSGTAASTVTLGTAASSLVNGTLVNVASMGAGVTMNLNIAGALGTLAQVTVGTGNTLSLGASQTFGSLAGGGMVTAPVAATLTVGNALNTTEYDSNFSGVLADGAAVLTLTKAGKGTLTLSGNQSNTYTGVSTTVTGGTLVLAKTDGAIAVSGSVTPGTSSIVIGTAASSTTGAATVRLEGNEQISDALNLTMNAGSTLDLNGYTETIETVLGVFGAQIIGNGTLILKRGPGTNTYTGVNLISATYQLSADVGATRTTNVTNVTDVLTITGNVTQGTAGGAITKTNLGTLILSGNNTFAGAMTINGGMVNIRSANALGNITGKTSVSAGATLQIQGGITTADEGLTLSGTGFTGAGGLNFQTGALVNVSGVNNYTGLVTLGAAATISSDSGTLNLTNAGTITGATFGLTLAGAGDGSVASILGTTTGGLTKSGSGTWILTGANTGTGAITVNNGTLQLGNGTSGSWTSAPALVFIGSGRFNYQGVTAGSTQSLGALTLTSGDGTVQSTYGTSGNTSLTFASLAARGVGATGNFVTFGGSNGTTNKIVLTGQTANAFLSQGLFFGGSSYAWNDAGGFVRALNYGTDAGAATSAGGSSLAGTAHQQITGEVTAQQSATFTTLNLSGNNGMTLAVGQTVTVNGILKSGNVAGGAVISGGTGIQAAAGAELVVRTDGLNDTLTISTAILANGSNGLTKSGAGSLLISGANTYTGATNVAAGTLQLGSGGTLTTSAITVHSGGALDLHGQAITNGVTLNGAGVANAGSLINSSSTGAQVGAVTLASSSFIGGAGNIVSTGVLTGLTFNLTKVGAGTLTLGDNLGTAQNSVRTGITQINEGILRISNSSSAIGAATAQLVLNGGTLSIGSAASIVAYPTAVTANSGIITDVYTSGAGLTHTLGALIMGGHTLTVSAGSNVTSATAGVTFGGTTLIGSPTFDVQSSAGKTTTLTLGAINDQGIAKEITFTNSGSSATSSMVTLGTAAGSLVDGTRVNLTTGTSGGVTVNLNAAAALGLMSQVTVDSDSTLTVGAAQTLGSLAGGGTVQTTGAAALILTVGNANSAVPRDTTFSGTLTNGTGTLALTKNGLGTLTLSGVSDYTGATVVTAGTLKLGSAAALGATSSVSVGVGATLDVNGQAVSRSITLNGTGLNSTGALINSSNSLSILTGAVALAGNTRSGGSGDILVNNTGGLTGNALLTKTGTGTLTITSTTTSARTGSNQIDQGTLRLQAATAIQPAGIGNMILNGGTLSLGYDVTGTVGGAVNLLSDSTLIVDRLTAGAGSNTLTLGAVTVGGGKLVIKAGSNVTSGNISLVLGATSLGGPSLLPGNPTFDVQGNSTATTTLTLGALSDQAIAPRTITFQNSGTGASTVNLGTAATSLVDGTVVNLASTGAVLTLNVNIANALGSFSQVTVGTGNTLSLNTSHTLAALNGGGIVTASAPSVITLGNILSPTITDSIFTGVMAGGDNLSVVKTGPSSLTLGGASTFSGGLTVSGGSLILANASGSATGSGNVSILAGSTLAGGGRIQTAANRSVSILGTLQVGNSSNTAAVMNILTSGTGSLFIDGSGVLVFDILSGLGQGDNTANAASADLLTIGGALTLTQGATLRVEYGGAGTFAAGDQWRLFDWTTLTGTQTGDFSRYELPTLSSGLTWDYSQLSSSGVLSVAFIPEPGRATLLIFATGILLLRRRRRTV